MKIITEIKLREEFKTKKGLNVYRVPKDHILSPSAKDFLSTKKIKIITSGNETVEERAKRIRENYGTKLSEYVDYETGEKYSSKPEYMTQLVEEYLVYKNHPRIVLRGQLDLFQSNIVLFQSELYERNEYKKLIDDLDDILACVRDMMRCEVLDEPFKREKLIGMTAAELRDRSHNPAKYFNVGRMALPKYNHGFVFSKLNLLRAQAREMELSGINAFLHDKKAERDDLLQMFNRLSSCMHILMCMFQNDEYEK